MSKLCLKKSKTFWVRVDEDVAGVILQVKLLKLNYTTEIRIEQRFSEVIMQTKKKRIETVSETTTILTLKNPESGAIHINSDEICSRFASEPN